MNCWVRSVQKFLYLGCAIALVIEPWAGRRGISRQVVWLLSMEQDDSATLILVSCASGCSQIGSSGFISYVWFCCHSSLVLSFEVKRDWPDCCEGVCCGCQACKISCSTVNLHSPISYHHRYRSVTSLWLLMPNSSLCCLNTASRWHASFNVVEYDHHMVVSGSMGKKGL